MNDYPSELGHWERIKDLATWMALDDISGTVTDICRALLDLNEARVREQES